MKIKQGSRCAPGARCIGVVLAAGLAMPAAAIDKSWNSDTGVWTEAGSWWPVGIPAATDHVFLGNIVGVQNTTVTLNQNDTITALTINDGMRLHTGGFHLDVNGPTLITGQNQEGVFVFSSALHVANAVVGPDFEGDGVRVLSEAVLYFNEGTLRSTDDVKVGASSFVRGDGTIQLSGAGTIFENDGRVEPGVSGGVVVTHLNAGELDLDGLTENGIIDLDRTGGPEFAAHGARLTDAFSGTIMIAPDARLHMNLSEGWTADSASVIDVSAGPAGSGEARLTGGTATFLGTINVDGNGSGTTLRIESGAVFGPTAMVDIGPDDLVQTIDAITLDGGTFVLHHGADLVLGGPTLVRGGNFETFSTDIGDGLVSFTGQTEWDGGASVNGVARHNGDATVIDTSVINATVLDMDGLGSTTWDVHAALTVNAGSIELGSNEFDGTINVSGSLPARLTINLADPDVPWVLAGEMNLTGNASLYFTRVAGSPMLVSGAIIVPSGRVNISAATTMHDVATLDIVDPEAVLRFLDSVRILADVTIGGAGTLQCGPTGDMTLEGGVSTAGVGVVNQGVFRVGTSPGIAAVDRFENTGTWRVQVGGYYAGAEHDQLIVSNGEAVVSGTLEVAVIDGFEPVLGDTFTILTGAGGVSGAFPAKAVSHVGAWTYEWTVISNANDITLELTGIEAPCAADFNHDGVVNSQDFFDFLARFFASDAMADVNGDAVVNSQDFFDFLVMFFKGCE